MKILQINKYFYRKGGAETVFFNTIKLLEEKGHTVIPFSLQNKKNISSPYSPFFVEYPELSESNLSTKIKNVFKFIYNKEAAENLERLIIKERPDIAHIHLMFNSLSVSILPVLKKHRIPIVMSVHDYRLVCPAYTFIDGKGNFCEKCAGGKFYNCITNKCSGNNLSNSMMLSLDSYFRHFFFSPINYIRKFIFVSNFSREKHIQINNNFKKKSTRLYNFTPSPKETNSVKGDYMFFFGRISNEKGIKTLLEAFKQLPKIQLKIAGTGPLFEELKMWSLPNVEFLGFRSGDDLKKQIMNSSFVIVPSECYENNPMSIIEAYTLGKPVIGSNIGGIPELIEEKKTGMLFTVKSVENLKEILAEADKITDKQYKDMSASAIEFAKNNFSEDNHYEKLISIYKETINNF